MSVVSATLHSVNLGVRVAAPWNRDVTWSGIDKRPVDGRVALAVGGVAGDLIADPRHHGGPDRAVYAHGREDAAWWAAELGREISPGVFGENLSTLGLDVTGAVIGERWAIGTAVLEVCQPRTPCRTFAGFWDVPDLARRFTARGAPGAYLRVVREGLVGRGDAVRVVDRPAHGVTLGEVFRAITGSRELLPRLLQAPQLPAELRDRARRRLRAA
jgi:MOSC domain-containing protein YiiM